MKKIIFSLIILSSSHFAQIVVTQPEYPTQIDSIVLFFDATQPGAEELLNYSGTVYAHTGVNTNFGNWQHVIGSWGNNQTQPALTRLGPNLYKLTIGYPRIFYSVTNPSEIIYALAIVFRSADATKQTRPDIFVDIYQPGLNIVVQNPQVEVKFGDPQRSPAFVKEGETVPIDIRAVEIQTRVQTIALFIDGNQVTQSDSARLIYNFNYLNYSVGAHIVKVVGVDTANTVDSTSFMMFVNPQIVDAPLPNGIRPGINYTSPVTATLALFAPYKDFIYVIGDFNDWKVQTNYFMKRQLVNQDSVIWWLELSSLSPGNEYAFQYLVDGKIRVGDPYSEKILDPWNDQFIPATTYPNLKPYPTGKTEKIVSILQTAQSQYQWQVQNFQKPPRENLVIYELHIRDFSTQRNFQFLIDTLSYLKSLGVNAIELMPIMEFSGNLSWGYNPIYHTAVDKYYGTATKLKQFIDLCHQNGIAVILDMVLNHADNLSPLAMIWWDDIQNKPAANSPYFNQNATHPFSVFNDFNHESNATKYFVDRVNEYWLKQFKFDGFRFDLSKGFTQNVSNDVGQWSQYDQSRINILARMADKIWEVDSTAYVILEHFADNSEEIVLSNYGMLLWGNLNHDYSEAAMGYQSSLSWGSYKSRGWNFPHLITYMESHDEERLMYKNLMFGNSMGDYDIRNLSIALQRIKLAATFLFPIPGPKMFWQFGELGYDISIDFNGRTGEKPIKWDYLNDLRRKNLYKVFRELINLKKNYEAFSTDNFTMDTGGFIKKINLFHSTMDVAIIGNFYVGPLSPSSNFSSTGWWYDFFSGDSIYVTNPTQQVTLQPGEFHIYTTVKLPTPEPGLLLDVENFEESSLPTEYKLEQNYPNPFNPTTKIKYSIPRSTEYYSVLQNVILKVYDVLGNEVETLVSEPKEPGYYEVEFDASGFASGIYFYRLQAGSFISTKKMMLVK